MKYVWKQVRNCGTVTGNKPRRWDRRWAPIWYNSQINEINDDLKRFFNPLIWAVQDKIKNNEPL